jgi:uncharacterized membrane protein YphA (DoxX/SURF4 family)
MKEKFLEYSTVPIRFWVGFVFLYFGLSKFLESQRDILQLIDFGIPASIAHIVNFLFGIIEVSISVSMFLGVLVKEAAIVASGILILIISRFSIKYGKLGFDSVFRDVAILGATSSLILRNKDPWCLYKSKD